MSFKDKFLIITSSKYRSYSKMLSSLADMKKSSKYRSYSETLSSLAEMKKSKAVLFWRRVKKINLNLRGFFRVNKMNNH